LGISIASSTFKAKIKEEHFSFFNAIMDTEATDLDAFKLTIILAILATVGILGVIIFITKDTINNAKIPDIERSLVTSKALSRKPHSKLRC
jgi:hypothetical protein